MKNKLLDYPEKLGLHPIPLYDYSETFVKNRNNENNYFTFAYYHDKTQYPLPMHKHDYYEVNIITNGVARHYIEDNSVNASRGTVFVLPPNIMHGYYAAPDCEIFHLVLSPSFMTNFSKELHSFQGFSLFFEIEPMLRKVLREEFFLQLSDFELSALIPELNNLIRCEDMKYSGTITLKNAKTLAIIGTLTYLYSQKKNKFYDHNQVSTPNLIAGVNYIHENYMEKIHLPDVAALCFMSYSTFSRYFKKIFNASPFDYLMKLRIEHAKVLLKNSNQTISDIAQNCGFFDQSHFSKHFYKFENITPIKYKKTFTKENA